MAGWLRDVDVTLLDGANELTHWRGSLSVSGGELVRYDGTPVGGPPEGAYSPDVRGHYIVEAEHLILGNDATERAAFQAKYAKGTTFDAPIITGLDTTGRRYTVTSSLPTHNYQGDSTLRIRLEETGAVPAV